MAAHSSTLAWKVPWTGEPGRLQSIGSLARSWTRLSNFTFTFHFHALEKEMNGNPLQCSCLENPRDRGACWAAVYGVAQSQTRLRRFSMHTRIGEGNGTPLQCSCLENPRDGGAWWAAVYGVAQSRTRLKRLSSSSNALI